MCELCAPDCTTRRSLPEDTAFILSRFCLLRFLLDRGPGFILHTYFHLVFFSFFFATSYLLPSTTYFSSKPDFTYDASLRDICNSPKMSTINEEGDEQYEDGDQPRNQISLPIEEHHPAVHLSGPPPMTLADLRANTEYMASWRDPKPFSKEYAAELLAQQPRSKNDLYLIGAPSTRSRTYLTPLRENIVPSTNNNIVDTRPPFLRLPQPIHRQIFAILLVPGTQVTPYRYFADPLIASLVGNNPKPQISLLQAFPGRQCAPALEAAREVLYGQNIFFFREPRDLMFFYGAVGEETCRRWFVMGGNLRVSFDFFYSVNSEHELAWWVENAWRFRTGRGAGVAGAGPGGSLPAVREDGEGDDSEEYVLVEEEMKEEG